MHIYTVPSYCTLCLIKSYNKAFFVDVALNSLLLFIYTRLYAIMFIKVCTIVYCILYYARAYIILCYEHSIFCTKLLLKLYLE